MMAKSLLLPWIGRYPTAIYSNRDGRVGTDATWLFCNQCRWHPVLGHLALGLKTWDILPLVDTCGGGSTQTFQKAVFQWQPGKGVFLVNVAA